MLPFFVPMRTSIIILTLFFVVFHSTAQSLLTRLNTGATLVSGHRGGFNDSLPENSMVNFKYTVAMCRQPVMLEFDLRKSKEGTLYIMHDATIDRTTNGTGELSNLTDEYIRTLYLRDARGKLTAERVPTFREFLVWAKSSTVWLMLDVKADVWAEALTMVHEFGLTDRCLVLTFRMADARRVRSLSPSVALSCLVSSEEEWRVLKTEHRVLSPVLAYVNSGITPALQAQIAAAGIKVLSDVSENTRHQGKVLSGPEYQQELSRVAGGILVTDYPIALTAVAGNPHRD